MRTVTIVVAMLDIAAWLLVAVVTLVLGSEAATRGVVGDAALAVTALVLATGVPALALALADSVPRTALMLALAFPPVLAMTVAAWA